LPSSFLWSFGSTLVDRKSPQIIANSPQFVTICRNLPQFAAICRKTPKLIAKRLRHFFGPHPRTPPLLLQLKNRGPKWWAEISCGPKWGAEISLAPSPLQKITFSGFFQRGFIRYMFPSNTYDIVDTTES
jgi:hypothetical protein